MRLALYGCDDSPTANFDPIVWEECACLLCGGDTWMPLREAADPLRVHDGLRFQIVKCHHCGLCYTNPRPDQLSIQQFYPSDYGCYVERQSGTKDRFWRTDPLRKLLPMHGKARLLDFGCGAGDLLERMHELGWNVVGMDMQESVVKWIRRERGLDAHAGTLPYPLWPDASFEAITMWQSLEHVHDPLEVLRDAHRLLTPGGRLLVTVPNVESLAARWFGPDWYALDVPRHLTHFAPDTLHGMLQRAGFATITIQQERHASWIRHSARLAEQRRHHTALTRWLKSRFGSTLAGWLARCRHQSESLCAIAIKDRPA